MSRDANGSGGRPVLVVTGGALRVGAGVVAHFAGLGFETLVTYRRSGDAARALADGLVARHGGRHLTVEADFSPGAVEDAIDRVHDAAQTHFGRLDVLLHNASLYEPSSVWETDLEQLRRFHAVHVEAPLLLTRRLAPLLKKASGLVVAMTDIQADRPAPSFAGYCASKSALANLVKSLAQALAPEIRVNAIAPGVVAWPEGTDAKTINRYLKRVPLGRSGEPEDVARALEALTHMPYVTGQTITLDGGRSLRP